MPVGVGCTNFVLNLQSSTCALTGENSLLPMSTFLNGLRVCHVSVNSIETRFSLRVWCLDGMSLQHSVHFFGVQVNVAEVRVMAHYWKFEGKEDPEPLTTELSAPVIRLPFVVLFEILSYALLL